MTFVDCDTSAAEHKINKMRIIRLNGISTYRIPHTYHEKKNKSENPLLSPNYKATIVWIAAATANIHCHRKSGGFDFNAHKILLAISNLLSDMLLLM